MVAKTLPSRMNSAVNPVLIRETVQKVERCITRLQELQFTVTRGTKIISGMKLSPRSNRGYSRSSLRCKQESLRMKATGTQRSPALAIQERANVQEWQRMSLPAMLLNETMVEILQASKLVSKFSTLSTAVGPRTPETELRGRKPLFEGTELRARRTKEKQLMSRPDSGSPIIRRARSRIIFKPSSPLNKRESSMNLAGDRPLISANRISPKNIPCTKKAVLFPNPLFRPTSPTHQKRFFKTRSPLIARTSHAPHKFLIKSQHKTLSSQFKSKKAVPEVTVAPIRNSKASSGKPRRYSFSPSKFADRLVSPLKTRLSLRNAGGGLMTALKQMPR